MDENPYKSPLTFDRPDAKRKPLVPPRVYWGDLIAWLAIGFVLAIFILPSGSRQDEERLIAWIIGGAWLLFGAVLAWFAMRRRSQ